MVKKLICPWCHQEMEYSVEENESTDFPVQHHWFCTNCGGEINDYEPSDDDKIDYGFSGEDGVEPDQCLTCGEHLVQNGNFNLSDFDDEVSENDDKMVYAYGPCPRCGHTKEILDLSVNDRFSFHHWNVERYLLENLKGYHLGTLLDLYIKANGGTKECIQKVADICGKYSYLLTNIETDAENKD